MDIEHDEALNGVSDDLLMRQLFELTLKGESDSTGEAARVEAAVYVRLAHAYGETIPGLEPTLAA